MITVGWMNYSYMGGGLLFPVISRVYKPPAYVAVYVYTHVRANGTDCVCTCICNLGLFVPRVQMF
jgi:hypothetical protein